MVSSLIFLVTGFALGWFANVKITVNHNHNGDIQEPQGYNPSYGSPEVKQYFDAANGGEY